MTTLIPAIGAIGDANKARVVMYANGQMVQAPLNAAVFAPLGIGADTGLSFARTSTTFDWNGPFTGTWKGANKFSSNDAATFAGSRSTAIFMRTADGSGTTGPTTADYALLTSSAKNNYLTSTIEGEIDGQYIAVRQGRKGDAAALLTDGAKVFGTGTDTGGLILHEGAGKKVDTAGNVTQRIQTGVNFAEGAGGVSGGTGYGFWTEAQVGSIFAAFHADQTTTSNGAAWSNFLFYTKDRTAGSAFYKVDGTGRTYGPDGTGPLPTFSWLSDPNTGIYNAAADTIGLTCGGSIRASLSTTLFGLSVPETINLNAVATSSLPTAPSGTALRLVQADATGTRATLDSFGGSGNLTFRSSSGTSAARTALVVDQIIGTIANIGAYDATNYSSSSRATINFQAAEAWTSTNQGAYVTIATTPIGSTTLGVIATFANTGVKLATSLSRGAPVTKTANFTLADTESWLIVNQAATTTVTLPAASSYSGREVTFKTIQAQTLVSASSNVVPLAGGAAGTAILAATAGKWATLVSDGSNWQIMAAN